MSNNRISEIDVIKGIGILAVMLQHCISVAGGVESLVSVWILSFHMPLFFFASGLLWKEKNTKDLLAGRMATLLSPVVLYSLFNVFIWVFLLVIHMDHLYSAFAFAGFWFLLSLLWITIIDYFVHGIIVNLDNERIQFIALLFVAAISLIFGIVYARRIVGKEVTIATALVGYGFYIFGRVSGKIIPRFKQINEAFAGRILLGVLGVIIFGLLVFSCQINQPVFMYISDYGNGFAFVLNSMIGIIGSSFFAFAIKSNRLLEFYGKNSLVILITHFPVHHICVKITTLFLSSLWLSSLLGFICTCVIEAVLVIIINRRFPVLKGKITL